VELLAITDSDQELEEHFDEVTTASLEEVAPQIKNGKQDVKVGGESIDKYDAVYTKIPHKNAVFGRVLLEMIEDTGIGTNISSTAFFTASKKNYLYYILQQKDVATPKTISIASEKATRGIEKHIKGPVVARRFEELEEVESKKLGTVEAMHGFAEGVEYEDQFILFHEFSSGEKIRCLKIGDKIISLSEDSDSWKFNGENLKYSNISNDREELVREAAAALGADIVEVKLRGDEVFDIEPNPDFSVYENKSGQDLYGKMVEVLEGDAR
jgi:glutathione synthase/RimK-type ligase-like ATP-grasp enzyme